MPDGGPLTRRTSSLLAAAGGALYFLGYLGWGIWPCLLVFLIPLWIAVDRSVGRAARLGLAFGATAYAGGFLWLWPLADAFLDGNRWLGAVLWGLYGAWFALGFAVYAGLVRRIRRNGWPMVVAGVAPLLLVEWLQPQLFPVHAGGALVPHVTWIQLADVGGPLLLTALVATANVVGFETWSWWRGRRSPPRALWLAGAVGLVVTVGYGRVRIAEVDRAVAAAPAVRVGLVQADLGALEKRRETDVAHATHLALTRALLADGDLDLVVWPETAYPRAIRRPLPVSGQPVLEGLAVPLLFGASSVLEQGGRRVGANSAFLIGSDGTIRDVYDKNLLIPFAEYVPLATVVPALASWFPHVQEFVASTETPALHFGAWRIATPICYEAVRPDFVRRMMTAAQPHLLVTLANDAWFGDSQEPWLHLALTRLRAVEHRRFLVRATNSGISAIVDPAGRIVAQTGLLTRETLRATVRPLDGTTVYGRLGDWPGWVAAAIVLFTIARRR